MFRHASIRLLLALFLLVPGAVAQAAAFYVSTAGDNNADGLTPGTAFLTIQRTLDASAAGDAIYLLGGTYRGAGNKNLLVDKAVTIAKAPGTGEVLLDMQSDGRAFELRADATLDGLTMLAGRPVDEYGVTTGGAIYSEGCSPVILNCAFKFNGGRAPTTLDELLFLKSFGGAIYLRGGSPRVARCLFEVNYADYGGCIMAAQTDGLVIDRCTFTASSSINEAQYGGGLFLSNSNGPAGLRGPVVRDCTFEYSSAYFQGGAIYCDDFEELTVANSAFYQTSATNFVLDWDEDGNLIITGAVGGGAVLLNSVERANLANVAFLNNQGGAIHAEGSHVTLTHATCAGNSVYQNDPVYGNLMLLNRGSFHIANSILWGNAAPYPLVNFAPAQGTFDVTYSNVQGGWLGEGNLNADPRYSETISSFVVNARLLSDSPCINAGHNDSLPSDDADLDGDGDTAEPIPFDLDGRPRVLADRVDMGAYEASRAPIASAGQDQTFSIPHDGDPATGADIALDGSASSDPDGDSLAYEWKEGGTVVGNAAVVTLHNRLAGTYTFTLTVRDPYGFSNSDDVSVTLNPEPNQWPTGNQIAIAAMPDTPVAITLTGSDLDGDSLAFYINEPGPQHGTLSGSGANRTYTPNPGFTGTDTIFFSVFDPYGGGGDGLVTITIQRADTRILVRSDSLGQFSGNPGQGVWLKGNVARLSDGAGLEGRTLVFKVDGQEVGTAMTIASGSAWFRYVIPVGLGAGEHTVTVAFAGDAQHNASSGQGTLTVGKADTRIRVISNSLEQFSGQAGKGVWLKGNVTRVLDRAGLEGRTLIFKVDGQQVGTAVTIASGSAWLYYAIPAGTPAGDQTVTVEFAGDADHNGSSGQGTLTVTP